MRGSIEPCRSAIACLCGHTSTHRPWVPEAPSEVVKGESKAHGEHEEPESISEKVRLEPGHLWMHARMEDRNKYFR